MKENIHKCFPESEQAIFVNACKTQENGVRAWGCHASECLRVVNSLCVTVNLLRVVKFAVRQGPLDCLMCKEFLLLWTFICLLPKNFRGSPSVVLPHLLVGKKIGIGEKRPPHPHTFSLTINTKIFAIQKKILRGINFVKLTKNIFQSTRLPEERMGVTKKIGGRNEFP